MAGCHGGRACTAGAAGVGPAPPCRTARTHVGVDRHQRAPHGHDERAAGELLAEGSARLVALELAVDQEGREAHRAGGRVGAGDWRVRAGCVAGGGGRVRCGGAAGEVETRPSRNCRRGCGPPAISRQEGLQNKSMKRGLTNFAGVALDADPVLGHIRISVEQGTARGGVRFLSEWVGTRGLCWVTQSRLARTLLAGSAERPRAPVAAAVGERHDADAALGGGVAAKAVALLVRCGVGGWLG